MVSARMKPFSKSVWITPAACGAVAPRLTVHARTAFGPAVKEVCRPSSEYAARITRFRPGSSRPMSRRNASRSASSSCTSSSSIAAHTGTTSAPSLAARARTASRCGLFANPSSRTLATYISGFSVNRNRARICDFSSSLRPSERAALPSSSAARSFSSSGRLAIASLSLALAARSAFASALSTASRSANASSVSMVSMSATGSTLPVTCTMSGCSKQRTTCAIASTSRMCARNWLPSPSPFDAPATRPAMSTNSTDAGMIFCGCTMSASCCRRGSGTGTTPTLGSIVQNGKFAAAMPAFVSALKSVDLPTLGRPTMPHLMRTANYGTWDSVEAKASAWVVRLWVQLEMNTIGEGLLLRVPGPESRVPRRVQSLHRLAEVAPDQQRQLVQCARDRVQHRLLVGPGGIAQHPRRHPVAVAGMADADAQAMERAVAEVGDDVAQSVLAAVAAVELQPRGAGRQIQIVVHHQQFLRRDLPVVQRRRHRDAAPVHVRRGLDQPHRLAVDLHPAGFRVQPALETETLARTRCQRIDEPETGVVPVAQVFGLGVAETSDEA